ncbi:MAG: 5-(carboxyamino)imidazole ribonucleotide synthase, partial [Pleurocapsa sp.]
MKYQRVGVIGGGQLAWMMGEAAPRLGLELIVQTPYPDDPAVSRAKEVILAPINDAIA